MTIKYVKLAIVMKKNFILVSPHFPDIYYKFAKALKEQGFNVLGVGNAPYHELKEELSSNLTEYYYCPNMESYEDLYKAVAFFAFKYGKISFIESNNEHWLMSDAKLREDFNIPGLKPEDMGFIKNKSLMKRKYKLAGVKTTPYVVFTTKEELLPFIEKYGYPLFIKPDIGVGASNSYKIENEGDFVRFFTNYDFKTPYICECFVDGKIVSYDAIVDANSNVIFATTHEFPVPNHLISLGLVDDYYYSIPVDDDLNKLAKNTIKAFEVKKHFVHLEFFKLNNDNSLIGKKGEYIGLEVNMRPAGAYTPEMINIGSNIDVYSLYAQMMNDSSITLDNEREQYICLEVTRRKEMIDKYLLTNNEILNKYNSLIILSGLYPEILAEGMGDYYFIGRFKNIEEAFEFKDKVLETK